MRVSTFQFYQTSSSNIGRKAAELTAQTPYISEGKRVLTAKDDPVANGTITGIKEELVRLEQYNRNIDSAISSNELIESSLAGGDALMNRMQQLFIQANSGVNSESDMQSLAREMRNVYDEMLSIANTRDEAGNYIFSGYQSSTRPFVATPGAGALYYGDFGERQIAISSGVTVATSASGDDVFMQVQNALGDFAPNYTTNAGGVALTKANIVDRGSYDPASPEPYTITFDAGPVVTVTDSSAATLLGPVAYTPGQTLAFNGVEVTLDGNPLPGDSVTLNEQPAKPLFDTLADAIAWVEVGKSPAEPTQHQVDYRHLLSQLQGATSHLIVKRAESGERLAALDRQRDFNDDLALTLNESKGKLEDLDYAKAVADFEQAKLALQASQQTFTQLQGMSLFNYL